MIKKWKKEVLKHKKQIILSILFLIVACMISYASGSYMDKTVVKQVPDIILDNIPVINLSFLYIWLYILVIAIFLVYPLLFKPKRFHYSVGMLGFFMIVRSVFIILTHLKPPVDAIPVAFPWLFDFLNFRYDMFFSGHTGLPFLGFWIFRKDSKYLGRFMLACSLILAATVLLMHAHYSIDVLGAFFITYGIFRFGTWMFRRFGLIKFEK